MDIAKAICKLTPPHMPEPGGMGPKRFGRSRAVR